MFYRNIVLVAILSALFISSVVADEIHDAAYAGDLDKVRALLEQNPDLFDAKDPNGATPLIHAARKGHAELVSFLIGKGANVNAANNMNWTALHNAAYGGHYDVARILVENGADIEIKTARGRTAFLINTMWGGNPDICSMLMEKGTDINTVDNYGTNPFESAAGNGFGKILDQLIQAGVVIPAEPGKIRNLVAAAARTGNETFFDFMMKKAAEAGQDFSSYNWLLQMAAVGGSTGILEKLLDMGMNPDVQDRYGMAPIHLAAATGRVEFIRKLAEKGADINIMAVNGKRAIHVAGDAGKEGVVALLKELNCNAGPQEFPLLQGAYLGEEPPGDTPKLFGLGIVSTGATEHSPAVFSPDGTEVFWTDEYRGPILYMKVEDGRWTKPAKAPFCSEYGDGEPMFSPDGNTIYFISFRPVTEGGRTDKENIWYVERAAQGWSDAQPLPPIVNDFETHWQVSLTADGTLYFPSESGESYGARDIYRCRKIDGEWQQPENLGPVINTDISEHTPYIAPDESYLIFTRVQGKGNIGYIDLYISFRTDDGGWTEPLNMGPQINSPAIQLCPVVSPDGKYIFFLSGRNGNSDTWWVSAGVIDELRKKAFEPENKTEVK